MYMYVMPPKLRVKPPKQSDLPIASKPLRNADLPIDILLLTVEDCEFLSCFSFLDRPFKRYKKEVGPIYFGYTGNNGDQEKLKVALMKCSKGAAVPGGSLTAVKNAVRVLSPKAVFSVGTCSGLSSDKVKLGDVVVSAKLTTAAGFKSPVSRHVSDLVRDAPYGWVAPLENPDELEVEVHCDGDILSQTQAVRCGCADLHLQYPEAIAVETEGEGVFAAAYDEKIEWVVVKGVASFVNQAQLSRSEWMSFASTMAASVVAKMLNNPVVFEEWPHCNQDILKKLETDVASSKDTLKETHDSLQQLKLQGASSITKLGETEDILKKLETDVASSKDTLKETHDAYVPAADFIDVIRELYKRREGWLAPFPWCEEFRFHIDNIFTRLKMVSRKKERGVKTDSMVNMLEIFKPHEECPQPRKVLIEGQPGVGKTTYCNKIAYDWAKNCKADDSFPDVQVLLLLKCKDISSELREAIDDQLLPKDMKKEEREKFFTFVWEHQSKVLLVLDGLDELPTHKLSVYKEVIQGRILSKCYLVVTARHETGISVRECCDTLLEVEGFTKNDAEDFIRKYFKTERHLAQKLLVKLWTDKSLSEITANPLNTALLCLLCEDFQGDLPKGRTLLYHEIVQCVLRKYRRKKELPETDEDLTQLYHTELKHLGCIALNGLLNDEMYFDDSAFQNGTSTLIPELGFLSAQPGRSKRRPGRCYGFLHKSFQEFFAAVYLSCHLIDEEINPDGLVADTRYFREFQQVLMFTCGILAQQCEAKAAALMASIASQINQSNWKESNDYLWTALNCVKECEKEQGTFEKELARTLGSLLEIQRISCGKQIGESGAALLAHAMATNSTVTKLDLLYYGIGESGVAALAKAVEINSTLTRLHLSHNGIGDSGAAALAKAVEINSTLTELDLPYNRIGYSGAAALAKAVEINSTLTELDLSGNGIGDSGAAALAKAVEINSTLTELYLRVNRIGDSGAAALAKAVEINSTLIYLDLSVNEIGDSGAAALAKAVEINSTLTKLDLSENRIGDSGAAELAKAVAINSTLTKLDLSCNGIGNSGAAALAKAVAINSTLTKLDLSENRIGDSGAAELAKAVEINSTLTHLCLSRNGIGNSGAAALAKAVEINLTLTHLYLSENRIGDSGAAALAKAVEINSTLTNLCLSRNGIGNSGAAALAKAVEINSTLTHLYLSGNRIFESGAAALAKAVEINSTLTDLCLSRNGIGNSGAAALAKAVEINSTLTRLDLSENGIGDSGAAELAKAVEINSTLTNLDLSRNGIGDSGAAELAKAVEINSTLTDLCLSRNGIGNSGAAALAKAVEINLTLTHLYLSENRIGDSGAAALAKADTLVRGL
ncbi:NLR family CARD domain-containing protein 3-like isoform X2 [Montipora foliosa]|uniref:NLR family CARD domain-containing protein 3-like isoform X2 n=1 Tax=Montipora foliosa TaxID=591990 RepID=UPI0035F10E0B